MFLLEFVKLSNPNDEAGKVVIRKAISNYLAMFRYKNKKKRQ